MEKFNAVVSQYHSLQRDLSLVLESAIVQPVTVEGNPEQSTPAWLTIQAVQSNN